MRFDASALGADFEHRCNRLTGSLDAITDLLQMKPLGDLMHAPTLPYLMELIAAEAHSLLDDDGSDERPASGPLRAVE